MREYLPDPTQDKLLFLINELSELHEDLHLSRIDGDGEAVRRVRKEIQTLRGKILEAYLELKVKANNLELQTKVAKWDDESEHRGLSR